MGALYDCISQSGINEALRALAKQVVLYASVMSHPDGKSQIGTLPFHLSADNRVFY